MAKKKIEPKTNLATVTSSPDGSGNQNMDTGDKVSVEVSQQMEQRPQPSVDAQQTAGWETLLDHVQKQDKKVEELEGALKDLFTYLQKQQGVNTTDQQQQPQQGQGGGTLDAIGGILQTVMKSQGQSETPSIESQLAGMQIENMRLMNQYITKRLIGDVQETTPVQHATVS